MQASCYALELPYVPLPSKEDVRKAYLRMSMKLHPDKHPEEQGRYKELFQKMQQAYDYLSHRLPTIQPQARSQGQPRDEAHCCRCNKPMKPGDLTEKCVRCNMDYHYYGCCHHQKCTGCNMDYHYYGCCHHQKCTGNAHEEQGQPQGQAQGQPQGQPSKRQHQTRRRRPMKRAPKKETKKGAKRVAKKAPAIGVAGLAEAVRKDLGWNEAESGKVTLLLQRLVSIGMKEVKRCGKFSIPQIAHVYQKKSILCQAFREAVLSAKK